MNKTNRKSRSAANSKKNNKRNRKYYRNIVEEDLQYYNKVYNTPYSDDAEKFFLKKELSKPKNKNQKIYQDNLNDENMKVLLVTGPAGTGKTLLSCEKGICNLLDGTINKLIITRPAVSVDESHGYLPGKIEDKMAPWMRPIYDIFYEFISPAEVKELIDNSSIEICPLAYMRGRTFKNAWIIADEMQNATINQMKMITTRIGEGSKLILTGDLKQHDRGYEENGLSDFIKRLNNRDTPPKQITNINFDVCDIERCPVVKEIIELYE